MRFGICYDIMKSPLLLAAGFDYIEGALTNIATTDDESFENMFQMVKETGLKVETLNLFLPGDLKLTGPDANLVAVEEYLSKCFDRAEILGAKIQVFGSGGARNVPDGWPKEKAMDQLVEFLKTACIYAAKCGIEIAIEPLNAKECNIINTVSEAVELANLVDMPNVGVLADWYHMRVQNEGVEGILEAKEKLIHCHIARPEGRTFPLANDGEDYSVFFDALRKIGYSARVSIEGSGEDDLLEKSLNKLRECV